MLDGPKKFLYGAIAGAGLMYLLDPDRGRRRRALLRDQLEHARHELDELGQTALSRSRDLRNRARGVMAETGARIAGEDVEDAVLVERVRAELGHVASAPGVIEVAARDGRITLSGRAPADEVARLVATARGVRGVRRVEQRLEMHERPAEATQPEGVTH